MKIRVCIFSFVFAITSLPLLAAPQQSLGDLARQLRQQQLKAGPKATTVYTNDNLPRPAPASGMTSTPAQSPSEKAKAEPDSDHEAAQTGTAPEAGQPANEPKKAENEKGTKEYWQSRFKSARARLADAEERQQLAEDELNLLQIQDARELSFTEKAELADKIKAKEGEVAEARAKAEEAQKTLQDLQDEFKARRAPDEWIETETETTQ